MTTETTPVTMVPIGELVEDERLVVIRDIDPDVIDACTRHLTDDGDDQWPWDPILVYRVDGQLLVVDGFYFLRAAAVKGRATVPCEIYDGDIHDAMATAAMEAAAWFLTATEIDRAIRMSLIAFPLFSRLRRNFPARLARHFRKYGRKVTAAQVRQIRDELDDMGLLD